MYKNKCFNIIREFCSLKKDATKREMHYQRYQRNKYKFHTPVTQFPMQ